MKRKELKKPRAVTKKTGAGTVRATRPLKGKVKAKTKPKKELLPPTGRGKAYDQLNPRQEKFARLYATDQEFFGDGVQSYLKVYDIDKSKKNWYLTACSAASQLLSNIKVCRRISELLTDQGLNNQHVDKQLLFVVTQFRDIPSKVQAIREYNKLKNRITEKVLVDDLRGKSDEELEAIIKARMSKTNNS